MRYWIWWNDIIQGPFELDELTALRAFSEDLLVCMEDREDWLPAGRVADLSSAIELARERRVGPISPPPPPPPKRPPIVTPLQGEFFGEPPGQQSLLESEDDPKGPYAYWPVTEDIDQPSSYFLGQATMPFHFMLQPRTSASVIEMPRPEPARVVTPPHITFTPPPVIKESPVRKPVEEPVFEEKIEEKPIIPLELFRERPASLAPMLGEPPAAERKLEWLPWIMGVVLAIGVLSSMGYWLLDRASTHSAIAEANRLELPKNLSQTYPSSSVGEGEAGRQVRRQSPPSQSSPIKGEGVLARIFSTLFGRAKSLNSSASSAVSQTSYGSRDGSADTSSQPSFPAAAGGESMQKPLKSMDPLPEAAGDDVSKNFDNHNNTRPSGAPISSQFVHSSPADSRSVWANAVNAILSKVGLTAAPVPPSSPVGFSSESSPAATGRGSMDLPAGRQGSPPATAGNDNKQAAGGKGTSGTPASSQSSQSSPAGSRSAWANAVSAILSKVGLAHASSQPSSPAAAGGESMQKSLKSMDPLPAAAGNDGVSTWVDSTQLQQSSKTSRAQASKAQASSQPAANSSALVKAVASILTKVGLMHVQSEMAANQAAAQAAGAASGAAASTALHMGSSLIPVLPIGSHTASGSSGGLSRASSKRSKSLSARSAHKGGKTTVKKKAAAHHAPKGKSSAQKTLPKNTALGAADGAEIAAAQAGAGSEGQISAPTAASAVAPVPGALVPGKTANVLPGVGSVLPSAAATPEAVPAVDAPTSTPARPPDPWKGKQNEAINLVMSKTLPKSKITIGSQARALLQEMHEKELLHAAETGERLYLPDKLAWAALQEEGPHYRVYLNFLAWQMNGERVQTRSYQFVVDLQHKEVHADDAATQQDLLTQPAELTFRHNPMATDIDSILGGVDTYNKHKVQMIIVKKSSRNREDRKKIETALAAAAAKVRRAVMYFRRTYAERALQNIGKAYDFMELLKG